MMRGKPAVLAVVFDFDETLVPDSTSKSLPSRGQTRLSSILNLQAHRVAGAAAGPR